MTSADDKFDQKIDRYLKEWPLAEPSEESLNKQCDSIRDRLQDLSPGSAQEDWFAPPCPQQPQEGSLSPSRPAGGLSMSDEAKPEEAAKPASEEADKPKPEPAAKSTDEDAKPKTEEPAKADSSGEDKSKSEEQAKPKRSLKEIAKRISVPPPPAGSASPSVPPPSANGKPSHPPARPSHPPARPSYPPARPSYPPGKLSATGTPLPVTSRPVEASDGDSGVVDLQAVREQAQSIPDAGTAPAQAGLFDEEEEQKPAAVAAAPVAAQPSPKKSSSTPLIVGAFVALSAIAAVAVLSLRGKSEAPATAQNAPAASAAAPLALASASPVAADTAATASAPAASAPGALARNEEPRAAAGDGKKRESTASNEDNKENKEESAPPPAAAPTATATATTADPTNLGSAMDKAVGAGSAAPASKSQDNQPKSHSADVPEIPSQGAIQGALGAVMGAARACVAGMEEPSRAQVTFSSDGSVANVSVSGAASGKPAAGCIVAALKRAKVTPFQRSSFSVGVTIRP